MTATTDSRPIPRHRLVAGAIGGNVMEWYDFTVYGYFAATIGTLFFPSEQPGVSLIAAFGVYAAGFLVRPFGAVLFGYLGDRIGRKRVLTVSILLMATPTTLIGTLPTYEDIGIYAPILLVFLRISQGLSASGELTGSIIYLIESGPSDRRGFFGSVSFVGAILGILCGSLVGALISAVGGPEMLEDWGWRIPFLAGSLLGIVGYLLRRRIPELPNRQDASPSPVMELFSGYRKQMLLGVPVAMLQGCGFVMLFVYLVTWLERQTGEPRADILAINSLSMVVLAIAAGTAGALSDRFGRRPILITAAAGMTVLAYPLLWLVGHANLALIMIGQAGFAILVGTVGGMVGVTLAELFPWRIRVTATSVTYNVSVMLFAGTAPMIGAWLVHITHHPMSIAWYLMAISVLALIAAFAMRETRGLPFEK